MAGTPRDEPVVAEAIAVRVIAAMDYLMMAEEGCPGWPPPLCVAGAFMLTHAALEIAYGIRK